MRRALTLVFGAALVLAMAAPALAQNGGSQVTVIHGIPGLDVDVYANGDELLPGFAPGTVTDPLTLPAGDYDIEIYAAGADPDTDTPALAETVTVPDGINASVVAHLDADGDPTLSVFVNDVSEIADGETRLTVRHTAAAPAVDVRADEAVVFSDLTNPNEASVDIPAGSVSADVVLAGTDTVAIGPADLDLEAGTAYFVYAWGSAADDNLDLLIQTVSGLGAEEPPAEEPPAEEAPAPAPAPTGVPAGTGGLAADGGFSVWLAVVAAAAALVAVGGGIGYARSRA